MRDWKIGARITLGFVTVIALSIVLGVFACCRVLTIERKATEVAKGNVPSVIALGHIQSEIYRVFELLLQHAASSDQQEVDTLEAQVRSIRDTNAKAYRTYEALPSTPEGVAIYEKVTADRTEFWSIVEEVSSGSRPGTDAGNAQAAKIVETRLRPVLRRYVEDLQAILDLDNKGTQEGLAEVVRSGSSANWGILIGLILCIAISAPITFLILRSISVPLAQAAAALEQVAKGDLTVTVDVRSKDEFGQMGMTLNNALKKLRRTLNEVSASAARTSSSSHELAAAAKEIAAGAQQQAASLEETSASLEEITAAVRQSADNACQVSQLAIGSRESAEKGQEVVSGSIAAMAEIDAASAKISDISSTIHEIAFQTNLLAVNAAIEAARAGEDGRGFAVVAMEVRSLAQRSAEAAKEIKGLIQDSLEKVKKGSELVNSSGSTLQGIVGLVKRVTDIVGEIASAAAEQSLGVEQVNSAITQMDRVTQSNSARTEELSSTAQSLAGQAAELMQLVATFTLGTERAPHGNRGPEPVHEANRDSVHGSHRVPSMTSVVSRDSPSPDTNGRKPSEPVFAVAAPRGADDANFEEF